MKRRALRTGAGPQTIARGGLVPPAVSLWLGLVALLIVAMIVLGGLTRLTDSGLSITEWRPVTGAIPPLSDAAWQAEFDKYKTIPEYALVNKGMTLDAFKAIYWWEWSHRFLGRLIGLVFFVPFVWFLVRRQLPSWVAPRLAVIFLLGAAQGALGWYMVKSGLSVRVDVSQYRLAAHLGLAFLIYGAVLWTLFDLGASRRAARGLSALALAAFAFLALVYLQILAGAFVAGLDAGLTYNTWPLMDGRFVPEGVGALEPWWRNLFENVATVQFVHRTLALGVFASALAVVGLAYRTTSSETLRARALLVLGAVSFQMALGITTLLAVAPLSLSIAHQFGAILLFSAALWQAHGLRPGT